MKTKKLDYYLPEELIATHPVSPRDAAKLLIIHKKSRKITESSFLHLGDFLRPGDVLVFNQSKVFAARTKGSLETGRKVEVFFLQPLGSRAWEVLIGGRVKEGQRINFTEDLWGTVKRGFPVRLELSQDDEAVYRYLDQFGEVPLPPYIKRKPTAKDKKEYQNIYAKEIGSAAAPTAGLHFTKRLLDGLEKQGIQLEYLTLHVGLGTFAPLKTEKVEEHQIHEERYEIDAATKQRLLQAKAAGCRIIACGTTSLRVLESMAQTPGAEKATTRIYIYPGYQFKFIDGLITNFHTPKSSLLALVWAFGGERLIKKAYRLAIKKKYRFFSYGDGMLIL